MNGALDQWLAWTTVSLLWMCLGALFVLVQKKSLTSLGFCAGSFFSGLGLLTIIPLFDHVDRASPGVWPRLESFIVGAAIAGWTLYVYGLLQTATIDDRRRRIVRLAIHAGLALALVNIVLGVLYPAQRFDDYHASLGTPGWSTAGFWLFAWVWIAVGIVFVGAQVILLGGELDSGEKPRYVSSFIAAGLWTVATALPPKAALVCVSVALVIALYGQFRFFVAQGERGAFLSRFLSRDVSDLVDARGLAEVMKPREVELTVVACDLRGFTSYAEAVPSQAVIDLLAEYYDAVGNAVADHGGTIKDYAGDGVLVLVGAPLSRADHAPAGLALANRLREAVTGVTGHWSTGPHPLGVGVGVASGKVTVGAIGSSTRMEYTAVGTAVNLASRLCSAATDGEILVDHRTVELADADGVQPRGSLEIKGLSAEQTVYAVAT